MSNYDENEKQDTPSNSLKKARNYISDKYDQTLSAIKWVATTAISVLGFIIVALAIYAGLSLNAEKESLRNLENQIRNQLSEQIKKDCIDSGFSSVMIDGSHHFFGENIRLTAEVVEYAYTKGVTVEGELGVLAGVEDEVSSEVSHYTQPEEVEEFVSKTGVDSLSISFGTSHGAHKFKLRPGEKPPTLRFDILEEVESRLPGYPIVLHGASSVSPEHVAMINQFGGNLESAVGIPAEQLRRAAQSAVCKINIDSDGRLAMTAVIRKIFSEKPSEFDPRKYLGSISARHELNLSN